MSGGQVAALIFAIVLLLPGGCFLLFGIGLSTERQMQEVGLAMLTIALLILGKI